MNPPDTHKRLGPILRRSLRDPYKDLDTGGFSRFERLARFGMDFGYDIGFSMVTALKYVGLDGATVEHPPLADGEDCWIHVRRQRQKNEDGTDTDTLRAQVFRRS
jgi:hypothetical protein